MQELKKYILDQLGEKYPVNEIKAIIRLIYEEVLNYSSSDIILKASEKISTEKYHEIKHIIERLKNDEPIQYVLGKTFFYEHTFNVLQNVLIPRPETEELVHIIINREKNPGLKVLDIGTGSGCIAISLALGLNEAEVHAIDVSADALNLARKNAEVLGAQVEIFNKDIITEELPFRHELDIIVSNPPYVRLKERKLMQKNVLEWEPELALFVSDDDPLVFYRTIAEKGLLSLKDEGRIYFEINEAFASEMVSMMQQKKYSNIEILKDLNGKDRFCIAKKRGSF